MSIAVQMSNSNRMVSQCLTMLNSPEIGATYKTVTAAVVVEDGETGEIAAVSSSASATSSSSIGENSDELAGKEEEEEEGDEVQSEVKKSSSSKFDDAIGALEEALPMRRGISRFYNGKSKSFATLSDASTCSSIKDITKPENAYSRKRKNLLAYSLLWDKKPSSSLLRSHGGGITKRAASSSRSTLAFAVMSASIDENGPDSGSAWSVSSPPFSPTSSPRFSRGASAWRSFSVADLRHCSSVVNCSSPSPP